MIIELISYKNQTAMDVLKYYHLSKKFRKLIFTSADYQLTTECGQSVKPHTVVNCYHKLILKIGYDDFDLKAVFESFNIHTIYEDEFLIIIDKPSGLYSHKATFNKNPNLSIQEIALLKGHKIHILTRLDKDTSGLMIILKYDFIHGMMHQQSVIKEYDASIYGEYNGPANLVYPIDRKDGSIIERAIDMNGLTSRTEIMDGHYDKTTNTTRLHLRLHTGRTHQIRVHLASVGFPIIGETLYANDSSLQLQLKCTHVSFIHPITLKRLTVNF